MGFHMPRLSKPSVMRGSRVELTILSVFVGVLLIAGGASRPEVAGQTIVRALAWAIVAALVVFGRRPVLAQSRPVAVLLAAAIVLPALQLIPLPPSLWAELPGRALFLEAAVVAGEIQPWRPVSISPSGTINALGSMVVPVAAFLVALGLSESGHRRLLHVLILSALAAGLVGLLQAAGGSLANPFVNDLPGEVSGLFANRNHLALFLAIACALVPAWGFRDAERSSWTELAAVALVTVFVLVVLATGSRAGLGLAMLGTVLGLLAVRKRIQRSLRRFSRITAILVAGFATTLFVGAIVASVALQRAASVQRIFAIDLSQDLRSRALPTIWEMTAHFFPLGTGMGAFDPVFRIFEPKALLGRQYLNLAHNDLLQMWLDGGLAAGLIFIAAVGWWVWASWRAWREQGSVFARLGSAIIALVLLASVTDYPARTPIIMAMIIFAAVWLSRPAMDFASGRLAPLPRQSENL